MELSFEQAKWIILCLVFLGLILYGLSHYRNLLTCPKCKAHKKTKIIKTKITPEPKKTTKYKIEKQLFLKCPNCNHTWRVFDEDYLNV